MNTLSITLTKDFLETNRISKVDCAIIYGGNDLFPAFRCREKGCKLFRLRSSDIDSILGIFRSMIQFLKNYTDKIIIIEPPYRNLCFCKDNTNLTQGFKRFKRLESLQENRVWIFKMSILIRYFFENIRHFESRALKTHLYVGRREQGYTGLIKEDGVHLSNLGYRKLSELISRHPFLQFTK